MARINLLPWRAELRKEKQREFFSVAAGSAVVTLLLIGYAHLHVSGQINTQNSRNQFLQKEITEVESRIKEITQLETQKQELVARMRVIERLQRNRPEIVHLFDELVRATPDGLHLTSLKQKDTTLKIEGVAQSNARVSAFIRNIDASPYLENPVLELIQNDEKTNNRKFTLTVTQTLTGASEDKPGQNSEQKKPG
jgi:type IV pilus assembly protein PilN